MSTKPQLFVKSANNVELHVLGSRAPNKLTIVIVNNFFMRAEQWSQFIPLLYKSANVINYDLRNQGLSTKNLDKVQIEDHVEDLFNLFDTLGLEQAIVIGVCASTVIAKYFATKYPMRVKGLVFVGPIFGPYIKHQRYFLHRSLIKSLESGGAEQLFDHYYPLLYTAKTLAAQRIGGYLALKNSFLKNNPTQQLKAYLNSTLDINDDLQDLTVLEIPVLLLAGEKDFILNIESLEEISKTLPQCERILIPNSGHNPYVETPREFDLAIANWLNEKFKTKGLCNDLRLQAQ